jgi:hypothetical protein
MRQPGRFAGFIGAVDTAEKAQRGGVE